MRLTTPKSVSPSVYKLREKIGVDTEPVFVPVKPEAGRKLNDCFADVARKVSRDGGSIVYGWTVWEIIGTFIEGEFHAVWKAPSGELVDVTTKADGERQILFIPDPSRVYCRVPVDNVRLALIDSPTINKEIRKCEEMGRLRIKYNDGTGESRIPFHEIVSLEKRFGDPAPVPLRTMAKVGRNEPCPCGSGKKYKRCHG